MGYMDYLPEDGNGGARMGRVCVIGEVVADMVTTTRGWDRVSAMLPHAKAIAYDGCHKIYVAMDCEQADWFTADYPHVLTRDEAGPGAMLETLMDWFDASCCLRFVTAVSTNHEDPNAGFSTLIGQFEDEGEGEV